MELTNKKELKFLLGQYGLRPQKRLGQHFLVDKGVLRDVISASRLSKKDIVLEIGPGIGTLTKELAMQAKKVIAVEKDKKMIEVLAETLKDFANIELIRGDILNLEARNSKFQIPNSKQISSSKFQIPNSYKVVANLPYYIVSPVIRMFLESKRPPKEMVLMVQKEVAQRICAKPPKMNLLAVSVQFYAEPKIIRYVKKTSFWPQPKVDSAIIKITRIRTERNIDSHKFFKIVKAGFSHPRKQIVNNLSHGLKIERAQVENILLKSGIKPTRRAETLALEEWHILVKLLTNKV